MKNRRNIVFGTDVIYFAPPEYVLIRKLQYFLEGGSQKHLRDIKTVLQISDSQIDHQELERKLAAMRILENWRNLGL